VCGIASIDKGGERRLLKTKLKIRESSPKGGKARTKIQDKS
jgi:hypothetical protein